MKVQVRIYLEEELADFFRREAVKQRVSLSALLAEQLSSLPDRMMEIQRQIAECFDRQNAAIHAVLQTAAQALAANSGDGLLARAKVKSREPELMVAALNQLDGELDRLPPEHRDRLMARGRELLAQSKNGASH
jgi:hypothetical protein